MGFIADNSFGYATDNDPNLRYGKVLGAGGYGSVHEVLCRLCMEAKLFRSMIILCRGYDNGESS